MLDDNQPIVKGRIQLYRWSICKNCAHNGHASISLLWSIVMCLTSQWHSLQAMTLHD